MTYIEFFTNTAVENVCACLAHPPQRVVLIGDKSKVLHRHVQRYERLFAGRGHQVEFVCRTVNKNNLGAILQVLTDLVECYDDCAFGLTGGDELYLVAVGIISARYPEKKLQMHRFNIRNAAIIDCDEDGNTIPKEGFRLSIEENVRIYGGDVGYMQPADGALEQWDMSEDFLADIRAMWDVCRQNVRRWNNQVDMLNAARGIGTTEDCLMYTLSRSQLASRIRGKKAFFPEIMKPLEKQGIVKVLDWGGDEIALVYKNEQVKRCLSKAGQVLEMFVYLAALEARDKDGAPVYHDVSNGVCIDWDGEAAEDANAAETRNEIDVMMMHGVVPVFVSCKNGTVSIDELYKLCSVAQRFGGKYAKKVLVATALDPNDPSDHSLRQRAKDMGIRLVDDLQSKDLTECNRIIRSFWSN